MTIDPVKIIKRAWHILWNYRALWVFGLVLALTVGGSSSGRGGSNSSNYQNNGQHSSPTPQSMQDAFRTFQNEVHRFFETGIPGTTITGKDVTTLLWVVGVFVLVMFLISIVMTIARYVSETAVIRMVDDYEATGSQMTVRQGFRIGWSRTSWRLFLINLIVNLPAIALALIALLAGIGIYFAWVNGNANFAAFSTVAAIVLGFITLFVVIVVTIVLNLLRNFFWRISVLEDAGVRESFRRGFAFARENWKNIGLMWLVMIGLGILWAVASVILVLVSIPVVIVTAVVAVLVAAIPYLLFVGIFSMFLGGFLPWIAGGLFIAPLFFTLAFSPWVLLTAWQQVFTSTVWTLTYREIKALPALAPAMMIEPVGD